VLKAMCTLQESLRSKLAAAETRATQLEQARSSAASTLESELRTLQVCCLACCILSTFKGPLDSQG
jgi:hypothetical protein